MISSPRFAIGLTGGIGSGKSLVADLFAQRGAAVVDTDLISHQLTAADGLAIAPIRKIFGADFMTADGAMDRAKMRDKVFTNAAAKRRLESILHPLIVSECQRAARTTVGDYLLFVVPLLIESNQWRNRVERVLVIDCDPAIQVQRVMRRSGLSAAQVQAIIATQASRVDRLAAADDVIVNDGAPEALDEPVERLHALYLTLSKRV
ncbi:MAG: dephospho-CoA kinase [Herbaspirillum sp.]